MLKHHIQDRGTLSYVQFDELLFNPVRMYYIHGVPAGETRGKHGHREDRQYLFCLNGKIKVHLVSKEGERFVTLNKGDSIFLDKMTWAEQTYETGEDIMLVLCSTAFDKNDYIYEVEEVL